MIGDFLQEFFKKVLLDLRDQIHSSCILLDLSVALMKVEILESNFEGVTFGEAIGSGDDSLLLKMFIEADTVGVMLILYIGGVENKFPLFEDGMGDNLFEFYFLLIFQQEGIGIEEDMFMAIDDKIMGVTVRKM